MGVSLSAKYCSLVLAVLFLSLSDLFKAKCLEFNFPSFQLENASQFLMTKSSIVLDAIQVTPDVRGAHISNFSGRALFKEPLTLWKGSAIASFNTTFVLRITKKTSPGGEGLAFILTANSSLPENSQGKWLGIVNPNSNGSSEAKVVAVEFDTRKSHEGDLDGNHIGVNINSIRSINQVSLTGYNFNISGGDDLTVHIRYDRKNLRILVGDQNATLVLSQPIGDLPKYLPNKVFVGFSASTGDETQLNCIRSWAFSSIDIGGDEDDLLLVWILIIISPVALSLSMGVAFYLYRRIRKMPPTEENNLEQGNIEDEIEHSNLAPRKFRLEELKQATGNFSPQNKLGKGGFGTVYKGSWKTKDGVVKRLSKKSNQGKQEFIAELTTIGYLNHKNLVKLIGWCYERRELLLVYEYMPNGSLDKYVFYHDNNKAAAAAGGGKEESINLGWDKRLTIIRGVGEALEYLHNGCKKRVLHRDIKASNIMLDSEFNATMGDFGLARTIQEKEKPHHSTIEIAGTPGYMAPETFLISRATVEADVYSFGVLTLEVVCGRKQPAAAAGIQNDNYNNSIVNRVWELHRKGKMTDAADPRMDGKFVGKEVECVLVLGLACCHPNPHYRPTMKTVLQVLSGEADSPELPKERPSFVWPPMPPSVTHQMIYSLAGSQLTPFTDLTGR